MNEVKKKSAPGAEATGKAAYVKPTIQVYEMEVEDAVLTGYGSGTRNGGSWGDDEARLSAPQRNGTWGNIWENEGTM